MVKTEFVLLRKLHIPLLLLSFIFCCEPLKADTILTYIFKDDIEQRIDLRDSMKIFTDDQGKYSIEEILTDTEVKFTTPDRGLKSEAPFVIWSRIQLINTGTKIQNAYFSFSPADSLWVYTIENGESTNIDISGLSLKLSDKSIWSKNNHIPFSIEAGNSKTYYFRLKFKENIDQNYRTLTYIRPARVLIQQLIEKYSTQYLYTGIMILFGMFSLFMFGMFRDSVFIFFTMILFFFTAYFLHTRGITDIFIHSRNQSGFVTLQSMIISGIILSNFLFISTYISLPKLLPEYYKLYLIVSIIAAAFFYISKLAGQDIQWIVQFNNFNMIIWFVLIIIPIIILARKRNKPARVLLISIGILIFSALVYVINLISGYNSNNWTRHSFQFGTILFSGTLFYGLFDKVNTIRREKQRIEELDHLKSRFFTNISHEFRTPLALIMGPVRQVSEKLKESKDKNLLQTALQNAQRLLRLINQMLDLSKLEAGKMKLHVQEYNFISLLKGITMSFESLAETKNIRLQFVTQKEGISLFADRDKMEKIFNNLLSNAFKFTDEGGEVSIMIIDRKANIEIVIQDTGAGIPESKLPYIFDRYFQTDSAEMHKNEGSGIGLALVRELVHLHSGKIEVNSKEGRGTTFTIQFPKGSAHFKEEEMLTQDITGTTGYNREIYSGLRHSDSDITDTTDDNTIFGFKPSNVKPSVLIIEDNTDVRNYIKQHLIPDFKISEVENGQEGIDKALDIIPDLIISDVMMPKKDGYEVCKTLKTDQRTSHIPIILLTAKAAQEEKLEGLETGADDYIVKPFDTKELEVRVRNLIELRKQLRKRNTQLDDIRSDSSALNSVDKVFLETIFVTLENHYSDSQFEVEILAKAVGMSRVHLNRKLRALTDHSANKFIQSYRLNKALELLKQKSGNVSEIAFQTGFSSTAYFVKCFRDKYGKTPGTLL